MKPSLFAALDLADAIETAKGEKKLLLVDASAEWCGPCKHMDATTWVDPKVVEALRANAIVIQIDVDAKPDDAARLKVKAMPTVVAFSSDGAEMDRVVGLQTSDELLRWVDGLARGETSLQSLRREVASKPDDSELRMTFAHRLADGGDLEGATAEYVWLWKHMHEKDEAHAGARHTFLAGAIHQLVETHPSTRAAFVELREAVAPQGDAIDEDRIADWLVLNAVLGEAAPTIAWYDAHAAPMLADAGLRKKVASQVLPVLIEAGRFADVGRLLDEPLRELGGLAAAREEVMKNCSAAGLPAEQVEAIEKMATGNLREVASLLSRALRAAERIEDAKAVEDEAQRLGVPVA